MADSDRETIAFATHRGLYQLTCMPFDMTNARATFMRLMSLALRGLEWEHCLVYLDDVMVYRVSFQQCLDNLEWVLGPLVDAGLKLKPSNCFLFQEQVSFLGHIVGWEGVTCDPNKVAAVQDWHAPTSVREVQSILVTAPV
jgi:hypothetical protein